MCWNLGRQVEIVSVTYGTSHEGQFDDLELRLSPHSCVTLGMLCNSWKSGVWICEGLTYSDYQMAGTVGHTDIDEWHLNFDDNLEYPLG